MGGITLRGRKFALQPLDLVKDQALAAADRLGNSVDDDSRGWAPRSLACHLSRAGATAWFWCSACIPSGAHVICKRIN